MTVVLVTGGAGYVGSHACKAIAADGMTPVTFDDLSAGHDWAVKWGPFVKGDLRDEADVDRAIAAYKPDAVMHFASHAYVGESMEAPEKYYRLNVGGTLNLLEAMARHGCRSLVFSSSCTVYGDVSDGPISEDRPLNPMNPYGATKMTAERMIRDIGGRHGIGAVVLRYFNAAGADPEGEIGEDHDPETHLIPNAIAAALGHIPALTVFGDDYPTPDGTCVRDYVHVSDLATAHVAALQRLRGGGQGGVFNLATGQGHSVKQVIETVTRVTGCQVPHAVAARRPGDPPSLVADASRAERELGWRPAFAGLEEIVESAVAWHKGRWGRTAAEARS